MCRQAKEALRVQTIFQEPTRFKSTVLRIPRARLDRRSELQLAAARRGKRAARPNSLLKKSTQVADFRDFLDLVALLPRHFIENIDLHFGKRA